MTSAQSRYFYDIRIHVRSDGERPPLVFDEAGVPAHYPTCLLLDLRARSVAWSTLNMVAQDLIHPAQALTYEGCEDLNGRLEGGR